MVNRAGVSAAPQNGRKSPEALTLSVPHPLGRLSGWRRRLVFALLGALHGLGCRDRLWHEELRAYRVG